MFGRVLTTRIVPDVMRDALFVRKMPRMLWVSTDPRRLIVKMTVKVQVAECDSIGTASRREVGCLPERAITGIQEYGDASPEARHDNINVTIPIHVSDGH